ncbi:MAG: CrcB family protein [Bacteroidetes bacterium]|nr:CrcB family protein [Bacteroidota bacterium]
MHWNSLLAVAAGGALGSVGRFALNELLPFDPNRWAWATFAANMLGCLCMGVLAPKLTSPELRLFAITGILGGFTTFSGLGLEIFKYIQGSNFILALGYGLSSLLLGTVLVFTGNKIAVLW